MNSDQINQWYEQYRTGIFRYILSITHDPILAEDVLQDTFVQLIVGGIRFDPGKEQAWLYKVARNRCYDILKKNKRSQEQLIPPPTVLGNNWEFLEMISPLTAAEQEIVTLKIVAGFSHKEIAKVTGSTVAASKKRYERAIQKLRDKTEVFL